MNDITDFSVSWSDSLPGDMYSCKDTNKHSSFHSHVYKYTPAAHRNAHDNTETVRRVLASNVDINGGVKVQTDMEEEPGQDHPSLRPRPPLKPFDTFSVTFCIMKSFLHSSQGQPFVLLQ